MLRKEGGVKAGTRICLRRHTRGGCERIVSEAGAVCPRGPVQGVSSASASLISGGSESEIKDRLTRIRKSGVAFHFIRAD